MNPGLALALAQGEQGHIALGHRKKITSGFLSFFLFLFPYSTLLCASVYMATSFVPIFEYQITLFKTTLNFQISNFDKSSPFE